MMPCCTKGVWYLVVMWSEMGSKNFWSAQQKYFCWAELVLHRTHEHAAEDKIADCFKQVA